MKEAETKEIAEALATYFDLKQVDTITFLAFRQNLIHQIQFLIDYDLNKLWALLYRIDVYEKKVKEAIATTPFTQHAEQIADLIISRQLEKINSRKKYSGKT